MKLHPMPMAKIMRNMILDWDEKYFKNESNSYVVVLVVLFELLYFLLELPIFLDFFQIGEMPEGIDNGSNNSIEEGNKEHK